jgi:flagellar basal body rod protein FlgC
MAWIRIGDEGNGTFASEASPNPSQVTSIDEVEGKITAVIAKIAAAGNIGMVSIPEIDVVREMYNTKITAIRINAENYKTILETLLAELQAL